MSLDTYLRTLEAATELPDPLSRWVEDQRHFDTDAFESADAAAHLVTLVEEAERLAEEHPTATLADRSVLTLAALANLRAGNRYLAAAEAAESERGLSVLASAEQSRVVRDPDLAEMVALIRSASSYSPAAQPTGEGTSVDLTDFQQQIQARVDSILKTGGTAITDLAKAVAWSKVGETVVALFERATRGTKIREGLDRLLGFVRRMAVRLVVAAVRALQRVLGEGSLGEIAEKIRERVEAWIAEAEKGAGAVGTLLGYAVDASSVASDCTTIVQKAGAGEEQQKAALAAAKRVDEHAALLGRGVDIAVSGIGLVGTWLWPSPAGPFVAAAILVSIAGAAWQVQDHLDSTEPLQLPDVAEGIRTAVKAAVAKA